MYGQMQYVLTKKTTGRKAIKYACYQPSFNQLSACVRGWGKRRTKAILLWTVCVKLQNRVKRQRYPLLKVRHGLLSISFSDVIGFGGSGLFKNWYWRRRLTCTAVIIKSNGRVSTSR